MSSCKEKASGGGIQREGRKIKDVKKEEKERRIITKKWQFANQIFHMESR